MGVTIEQIVIFITVCGIVGGIIHNRSSAAKAQNDQFHARINKGVEDQHATDVKVAHLKGYNEGVQVGRAQIVQELNLPSKSNDS